MSNKVKIAWSAWIGILTGLYLIIYLNTPLGQHKVVWMSFVALPIYFNGGAKRSEFFHYSLSYIIGVLWGALMLKGLGAAAPSIGMIPAMGIVVGLLTIACCAIHMMLPEKALLTKVPAIFGGMACAFACSFLGEPISIAMITLVGGTILGLLCMEGLAPIMKMLDK
ncbi:MAG: DUF1097 domain-containing protein [Fusobacteriaceae bacterium]|jgi:hypothetical protein|nr:DUF1097 domain-containing protein [Fusobacteriaceae bacterium]